MAELPQPFQLPAAQQAQQATAAIRGFVYQIYATCLAWLALEGDGLLLVEVAEDYAVVADKALKAVQVRDTAGSGLITLRTKGVRQAIDNLWRLRQQNIDRDIRAVYLTTSGAGRERDSPLPRGARGLVEWETVAAGYGNAAQFRKLLLGMPFASDLKAWLKESTNARLREQLLDRMTWRLAAPAIDGMAERFQIAAAIRCEAFGLFPAEANKAADAVFMHVLKVAASPGLRRLDRLQLNQTIQDATYVLADPASVRGARQPARDFLPPLDSRTRDDPGDRLFFFGAADRTQFVGRAKESEALSVWARSAPDFSWTLVTGIGGMGKSRLALELCQELEADGWHAGFLADGSRLTAPDLFARFRPQRPTLIVIDYVSHSPEWAGEIVRTLIDASVIAPFTPSVRVLLLERTGASAPWWQRFNDGHDQRLAGRSARLGMGAAYMNLRGLEPDDLWTILRNVAGPLDRKHRRAILRGLATIDPRGTPLFTALAGEAIRSGRAIWQFDRRALLSDIFLREQSRWRDLAGSAEDLSRHERAAALATMLGGLDLRRVADVVTSPLFPFSSSRFNGPLAEAINGPTPTPNQIVAMEPDILGEWFVLQRCRRENPFDDSPVALRRAAAALTAVSEQLRWSFVQFRIRLAEDFPEEALETGLFDPPASDAAAPQYAAWITVMANVFHDLVDHSAEIARLFGQILEARARFAADIEVQINATAAIANYAALRANDGAVAEAAALFRTIAWPRSSGEFSEIALGVSRAGVMIGRALINAGDTATAFTIFEELRAHAERFLTVPQADWEEMQDATALLGLTLRRRFKDERNAQAVTEMDAILWGQPATGRADLARAAAQMLATVGIDESFAEIEYIVAELASRSSDRQEVSDVAFWTANALYGWAREEGHARTFVDVVRRLAAWIEPRIDLKDMSDVYWDAVRQGWIDKKFGLGRAPIEALFELWRAVRDAAYDAGRSPQTDNQVQSLRGELEDALAKAPRKTWATNIVRQLHGVAGAA